MGIREKLGFLPKVEKLTPELMGKINKVYDRFSYGENFPSGYCDKVATSLIKLGLRVACGYFLTDESYRRYHVWVIDADKKIIDLTASQFNDDLRNPIPSGVLVIVPKDPLYKRYQPDKAMRFVPWKQ